MKKITFLIAFIIASVTLFAQAPFFKGVAMEGSINDFMTKMKSKGCVFEERTKTPDTGSDVITMKGSYAGYQNCQIVLFADDQGKEIMGVRVIMPLKFYKFGEVFEGLSDNYKDVRSMYIDVKSKLTDKYGKPILVLEDEIDTYQGGEIRKIAEMEGYGCFWLDEGLNEISIEISTNEISYHYYASVRVDIRNSSTVKKSRDNVLDDM